MNCDFLFFSLGIGVFVVAAIFSIAMLAAYSNFLAWASKKHPQLAKDLAPEYGEQWSNKNLQVMSYFLNKTYASLDDEKIVELGRLVRWRGCSSFGCCVLALFVFVGRAWFSQFFCGL